MNILVTGACGQLGRMIRSIAPDSRHRFIFADIAEAEGLETLRLDVTDEAALRRVRASPSWPNGSMRRHLP